MQSVYYLQHMLARVFLPLALLIVLYSVYATTNH